MSRFRSIVVASVCALFFVPGLAGAATYSFDRFDASYVIDPSGAIFLTEDIAVNFNTERHGLFWKVPVSYVTDTGDRRSIRLRVLDIKDAAGNDVPFETSREGDLLVVKIGDPDRVVSGPTFYRMHSVLERVWNSFPEQDEFYWNVVGFTHEAVPKKVTAAVQLPSGTTMEAVRTRCFAGPEGSTDESGCTSGRSGDGLVFASKSPMTIVIGVPKGTVRMPAVIDRVRWFVEDNFILSVPLVVFMILSVVWYFLGRDPKGRGTIIPEYEPPAGFDPVSLGAMLDAKVHPRDVTAGIIGLAVNGYLTIKPEGKDEKKPSSWMIKSTAKEATALGPVEKELLDKLFEDSTEVVLKPSAGTMQEMFNKVSEFVYQRLVDEAYFLRHPQKVRAFFFGTGVALFSVAWFLSFGWSWFAAFAAIALEFAVFGFIMPKMTRKGALIREQARGFRLFLETAERDRLKWQEKEGLFEKYLPYALVFGVVSQWTRVFAGSLQGSSPSWYRGTNWSPANFSTSLSSLSSTMGRASRSPASGGTSGFSSGGGSSGGGFGGGGSSSW